MSAVVKGALLCLFFSTVYVGSKDIPKTPFEDINQYIKTLDTRGISTGSYSLLSVDEKHNNLLVGARNNAFLVNLDDIDTYVSWNVSKPSSRVTCDKTKDVLCNNFVKIMLTFKERILLCWTGKQFTAGCTWKNRTNLQDAPGNDNEGYVFKSAEVYDLASLGPDQNDTSVITEHGTLFTGTFQPYRDKSVIYSKSFKQAQLSKQVYTALKESSFFADVHFVKSFEIGQYVYFFFRERTLECQSCGKFKISRVARMCKGDLGGKYSLKSIFLTFQKAKLTCSDGKDYPVNFNEIQDVWWDNSTSLFHAIFTSQPNAPPSSAICIYSLSSINRVFDESPFKSFQNNDEHWSKVENNHREFFQDCKVNPKYISDSSPVPDGMMATTKIKFSAYPQLMHDPLMADSVEPTSSQAWFIRNGIRMTGIALEKIGANTVVYTSTDRGSVMKVSQPSELPQPCLLTEIDIFPNGKKEVIKKIVIDTNRHALYLGSSTTLSKLNLEQCDRFLHDRSACISAADPYCGWDEKTSSCVSILAASAPSELKQDLSTCPKAKEVGWSPWRTCTQTDGNLCRCQDRQNSSFEGGLEFRLENCTVDMTLGWEGKEAWKMLGVQHGNWSVWGNWSECSAKAWAGVRNRTRTCTNPAPRRGGKPCVGEMVQYEPCSLGIHEEEKHLWTKPTRVLNPAENMAVKFKVTFRAKGYKITDISVEMSNQTIDCEKERQLCGEGEWDSWGDWSLCSVEGFQIRRRECKVEPCVGERLQERSCKPTSGKCEGGVDKSWDKWSECVCNSGLDLPGESGVMYRVHKCRRVCPSVPACPDTIDFKSCKCNSAASMGQRGDSNSADGSAFGIGHVLGAAAVGCVFAIVLCVVAIMYVKRKKKQFNVSKTEKSLQDPSDENKYSPIPQENGGLLKPPSPTNSGKRDKNRNSKSKTSSPLKFCFSRSKTRHPMDAV